MRAVDGLLLERDNSSSSHASREAAQTATNRQGRTTAAAHVPQANDADGTTADELTQPGIQPLTPLETGLQQPPIVLPGGDFFAPALPLDFALAPPNRPLIPTPRSPEEQAARRSQEVQILLGTRNRDGSSPRAGRSSSVTSPAAQQQQQQPGQQPTDYFGPSRTTADASAPSESENSASVERVLRAISDIRRPSYFDENNMASTGNIAAGRVTEREVGAPASSSLRQQQLPEWQRDPGHFRLRSHLPQDELMGSLNPFRQFLSSVYEAEMHTFFFMVELTIFAYVVYLGFAHAGLWPNEFNHFAAYIAGILKGFSLGLIITLGALRYGTTHRTVSSRRKQRVATAEEEVGIFRVEVAFSLSIYLFLLTVFWENLPHASAPPHVLASANPPSDADASLGLRLLRAGARATGLTKPWGSVERWLYSFGAGAADAASGTARGAAARVSHAVGSAASGRSAADRAHDALARIGAAPGGKSKGISDLILYRAGLARYIGTPQGWAAAVDGFIDKRMGWHLHPAPIFTSA